MGSGKRIKRTRKSEAQPDKEFLPACSFTLEELKEIPVAERSRMLGPTYKIKYFKQVALLSFWTPIALIFTNVILIGLNSENAIDGWMIGLILGAVTSVPVLLAHLAIQNGCASSNQGTYTREKEPIRFWVSIIFLYAVTLLFNIACFVECGPLTW